MKRLLTLASLAILCWFAASPVLQANSETSPLFPGNPLPITISVVLQEDVSCFGLTDGLVTVNATGGVAPYTYVWSNGMVGPALVGLSAGAYTVTATDLLAATATLSVTIDQPLELEVDLVSQVNIDCGDPSGSATVTTSGGTGAIAYLWSNGQTTPTATNLTAGVHTVLVTDANLCTDLHAVTITADVTLPAVNASVSAEITCLEPEVILSAAGSATGANIAYLWTTVDGHIVSGANSMNPVVDEEGTYTLTVTNLLNECTASESVVVEADVQLPAVNIQSGGGVDLQIDCLTPTITLDGTGSATGAGILYLWTTVNGVINSGGNTLNPIVSAAGTYTLSVTNAANGCSDSESVVVTADVETPLAVIQAGAGVDLQIDCLTPTITLSGAGSASGAGISYLWTTVNGNIVSGANTLNPVVSAAGNYVLTVTDLLNGCSASANVNVTIDITIPAVNIQAGANVDLQIDCLTPTITLNGSGSATGANILYLWTTVDGTIVSGANTLTPIVSAEGTYTLLVTNSANGCSDSESVDVSIDIDIPAVNIQTGVGVDLQIDCLSPTITLNGTGSATGAGITYLWTTVNGNIVSGANTLNPVVNVAGEYTLTVTDGGNGCTDSESVTVTADVSLPLVNIQAGAGVDLQIDCLTPTITLDATGSASGPGVTYLWATVNGNIVSGGNTLTPVVNAAGTYTLTITAASGCSATDAVNVTVDLDLPSVIIAAGANVDLQIDCLTPTITLDASASASGAGITYLWTTVNGHIVAGATTLTPVVDAAGTYTLSISDASNGCSASSSVNVTLDVSLPTVSIQTPTVSLGCQNSSIVLNASGSSQGAGYVYLWTTVNGNIVTGANTLTPTVNAAGTYTLTITAPNGCTATASVTVTGTATVVVSITNLVNISCFGGVTGSATVQVSAGAAPFTYLWSNGSASATVSNLAAGTYQVTVTDANGCQAVVSVTISQPAALQATATATAVTQPGAANGTATVSVTGGTSPFTYLWSNGQTTATITGLVTGSYSFTVTDANGCTDTETVIVPDAGGCAISVAIANVIASGCNTNIGGATSTVIGATGTVTYAWSNGATSAVLSGVGGGTYTVTVTAGANCTATASVNIPVIDNTPPTVITKNITVNLTANGTTTITAAMVNNGSSDACGNVTVTVDVTTFDCDDLGANTVTLTVTDPSGNTATGTATVTVVDNTAPVADCPDNMTVQECSGIVNYDLPTLTDNCDATVDPTLVLMAGFASGSVFPAGTTTVTYAVVSATGQISTCSFNVTLSGTLDVDVDVNAPSCAGEADGSATATVSGGSGNYTYLWLNANNQTGATATGLSAGSYTVVVSDDAGCVSVSTVTISNPTEIDIDIVVVTDECGLSLGQIDITVSGGTAPYTYVWYDANGNIIATTQDLNNVPAGGYTVEVTDANGCTFSIEGITVSLLNGSEEVDALLGSAEVSPNPVSNGDATLYLEFPTEREVSVQLHDVTGQFLATVLPKQNWLSGEAALDFSAYPAGSYLVKVFADGKQAKTLKVVVVK